MMPALFDTAVEIMPIAEQLSGEMASLLCRPESEFSGGLL
jgi:hypothetical protein